MHIWLIAKSAENSHLNDDIRTYVATITQAWAAAGHEVTVFYPHKDKIATAISSHGTPVAVDIKDYAEIIGQWAEPNHQFSYAVAEEIEARLKNPNTPAPDVIEVQACHAPGYFLIRKKLTLNATIASIPILVHTHTPTYDYAKENGTLKYVFPNYRIGQSEKYTMLGADILLSGSHFMADRIEKDIGRRPDVLPLPFLLSSKSKKPAVQKSPPSSFYYDLVYEGPLQKGCGVIELVQALDKLWHQGATHRLAIVGESGLWEAQSTTIKEHLQKKYSQRIKQNLLTILSLKNSSKIRARVAVVPFLTGNFSYKCASAMASGLPVLASNTCGQKDMVNKGGGMVFTWEKAGDFAHKLTSMMALDTRALQDMGQQGKAAIALRYSPEKYVKKRQAQLARFTKHETATVKGGRYPFLTPACYSDKVPPYKIQKNSKEKKGFLTVIIPFYNLGEFVEEAVASVMQSTFEKIKVVIINDASPEKSSLKVLQKIEKSSWRFPLEVWHLDQNVGLAAVRNAGVKKASTEFITFLDADDQVTSTYYEKCVAIMHAYNNASMVNAAYQNFTHDDGKIVKRLHHINTDPELPFLLGQNMMTPCTVVRRQDYLKYGIQCSDMKLAEDWHGWLKMLANGCFCVKIPEVLTKYRVRENSMWHKPSIASKLYYYEVLLDVSDTIYKTWGGELNKIISTNGTPGWLWRGQGLQEKILNSNASPINALTTLSKDFSPKQLANIATIIRNEKYTALIKVLLSHRGLNRLLHIAMNIATRLYFFGRKLKKVVKKARQ